MPGIFIAEESPNANIFPENRHPNQKVSRNKKMVNLLINLVAQKSPLAPKPVIIDFQPTLLETRSKSLIKRNSRSILVRSDDIR